MAKMYIPNSMFNGIDLSQAKITWPELDDEVFAVGDTVYDQIMKPGQQGKVIEVVGKHHYKVEWPGGQVEEYPELESVWLHGQAEEDDEQLSDAASSES